MSTDTLSPSDLLLLIFRASDSNRIDGRTAIQKVAYFCITKLGIGRYFDYMPHYYGPFSPQITYIVEQLISLGLIGEREIMTTNRRKLYSYYLTTEGKAYSENIMRKFKAYFDKVSRVVKAVEKIEGDRIDILSCAAKVHYLVTTNREKLKPSTAIEKAKSFGWKLESEQISASTSLLQEIYN